MRQSFRERYSAKLKSFPSGKDIVQELRIFPIEFGENGGSIKERIFIACMKIGGLHELGSTIEIAAIAHLAVISSTRVGFSIPTDEALSRVCNEFLSLEDENREPLSRVCVIHKQIHLQ